MNARLETGPICTVQIGDERARVYCEGGVGFDRFVKGVGWVVNDKPGRLIARYAFAVRKLHAKL